LGSLFGQSSKIDNSMLELQEEEAHLIILLSLSNEVLYEVYWKQDCPKKAKKYFVAALVQNDSSSENDLILVSGDQLQQHFE